MPCWFPPLFYLMLATAFLWRSIFTGDVFLPAHLLMQVAPYSAGADHVVAWNALRWDGIAAFYPWRHFAAASFRHGVIPLWNPFQFSGTPFLANCQSAALYPGNLPCYLLPIGRGFGLTVVLHLALCGWFLHLLLRRLGCGDVGSLVGGTVYAYSAWQVAWLQLPSFLATSCWFPLLLRQIYVLYARERDGKRSLSISVRATGGLGAVVGLILLAGHLQIAFYGLLAGSLWAVALLSDLLRSRRAGAAARLLMPLIGGLALGFMVAAPQLAPTLELSRLGHRAGKPTPQGYAAYVEYAMPAHTLITLALPDFFGSDTDASRPYWNFYTKRLPDGHYQPIRHNAAETAAFVGVLTMMLGTVALVRLRLSDRHPRDAAAVSRVTLFFALLALLALLLALGTIMDALLYFGVPGFGQSGSPARCLVLWSLAWSVLAGFGADSIQRRRASLREVVVGLSPVLFSLAIGVLLLWVTLINPSAQQHIPDFAGALSQEGAGWARLALFMALGVGLLVARAPDRGPTSASPCRLPLGLQPAGAALVLLVAIELFSAGINANPTASIDEVYPMTPGLAFVRAHAGHDRVFPINQLWSLYKAPPAVLPPNAATVYEFRDVQGYDSLFPGQYRGFAATFARPRPYDGVVDASPPEVGNMLFFQNANAPLAPMTGASLVLSSAPGTRGFAAEAVPAVAPIYSADGEMSVYPLPGAHGRATFAAGDGAHIDCPMTWIEDGSTRVRLDITAPTSGRFDLSDQYYPGWRATIDGLGTRIERQPGAPVYRSVRVSAGRHRVAFRYEPAGFRFGLYAACLAAALFAALMTTARPIRGISDLDREM